MRRVTMAALAALALAPAAGRAAEPAYGPAAPLYREIADWLLACDNTRACVAKAVPDDNAAAALPDDAMPGYVRFSRAGGPAVAAQVTLAADAPFVPDPRLDGKPVAARGWTRSKEGDTASLAGEAALAFMRLIRNGSVLQLAAGKAAPQASLHGVTAALLAMDEAQGRIGNASALARPGPAPAGATPAAPLPPLVHAAAAPPALPGAKALIAAVRRTQGPLFKARDCEPEAAADDAAAPLTANEAVVLLGCVRGAYQSGLLAFRVPRTAPDKARLLVLPHPPTLPAEDADAAGEYTEAAYDPATATFSESAKGRGIADCGISDQWVFDGRDFHLSQLAHQDRCGGGEPGDWPTVYRTRVAR
jgi:Protein of unknown function (DUF1176)